MGDHALVALPHTEASTLCSRSGNREYRISVAVPPGKPPVNGFPVIYLLDGNATFATMVEAVRMRSERSAMTGVEPAVVVGIGYPTDGTYHRERRTYDYTPADTARALSPGADAGESPVTGGATEFRAFIESELKPRIEHRAPIDRARQSLFGHSLAGLFVLHTLCAAPGAFATYAAVSPSIWMDPHGLSAAVHALLRRTDLPTPPPSVLITVGQFEQALAPWQVAAPNIGEVRRRRAERRMVDSAHEIAARLSTPPLDRLRVQFAELDGEDHASAVLRSISPFLRVALAPPP